MSTLRNSIGLFLVVFGTVALFQTLAYTLPGSDSDDVYWDDRFASSPPLNGGAVYALAHGPGGKVYAGGSFTSAGGTAAQGAAVWDGVKWQTAGRGVFSVTTTVYAVARLSSDGRFVVGGDFVQAGSAHASYCAWYDEASGIWQQMTGGEVNGTVYALEADNANNIYVGGNFASAGAAGTVSNIARWNGSQWFALGTGVNGKVTALALDSSGNLYVGGKFSSASGVPANNIAKWNGTAWSALGTGTNKEVDALAVDDLGNVYVGGKFTTAGGSSASIAKWNGTAWSSLGTVTVGGTVNALAVDASGAVYAGGDFSGVIGVAGTHSCAKWTSSGWVAMGSFNQPVYALTLDPSGVLHIGGAFTNFNNTGPSYLITWGGSAPDFGGNAVNDAVNALVVESCGKLVAGGAFTTASHVPANHITECNGTTWSALGAGAPNGVVNALATNGSGHLYAGGMFTDILQWTGTAWSALGTGTSGFVYALATDASGNVYAGGTFSMAGGSSNFVRNVTKWNGTQWLALGVGVSGTNVRVNSLVLDNAGNLYAGGVFTYAGGIAVNNVAKWNGTAWSALGTGTNGTVRALALDASGNLYAGGAFTTAGGVATNNIAKWNGSTWSALGTGLSASAHALTVDGAGSLYAGGTFTTAGGITVNNIAKWNGTAWLALGTGTNGAVETLTLDVSGNLCMGGAFTAVDGELRERIARWNGTTWHEHQASFGVLTTGLNGNVNAVKTDTAGNVYAGGPFTSADGIPISGIAKFDGKDWSGLGEGVDGPVFSIKLDGAGNLYAGGNITGAGGTSAAHIAKWDGSAWSNLGAGTNGPVRALEMDRSGNLYAGGLFSTAGGVTVNNIAKWNGTEWSALQTGTNGEILAIYVNPLTGHVYVGGAFTSAGGVANTEYVSEWDGSAWVPCGPSLGNRVYALYGVPSPFGPLLYFYAVGAFTLGNYIDYFGDLAYGQWHSHCYPYNHATNGPIHTFFVTGEGVWHNQVYIGGAFTKDTNANGPTLNYVGMAYYDQYYALGSGVDAPVSSLTVDRNTLFVGGQFSNAGGKSSRGFGVWQPRVNSSRASFSARPSGRTLGGDPYGFYQPALMTLPGTIVSAKNLPVSVSIDLPGPVNVNGHRVNGAFEIGYANVQFGGAGVILRVEFSEDDVAAFGSSPSDFRLCTMNGSVLTPLSLCTATPSRFENERQIYAITAPLNSLTLSNSLLFGAVPESLLFAAAPSNPGATCALNDITWSWTDNSGESGFKVYDDPGAGPPTTLRTTTAANATSWQHTELATNTQYAFQVAATNVLGDSPKTANYAAWTLIEPVSTLAFSGITTSAIGVASANVPTNLTSGSSGLFLANTTAGTDSGWKQNNAVWMSSDLSTNTQYAFTGQSRNGDATTTTAASASKYTLIEPVSDLTFSGLTTSAMTVASTNTPSNLTSGSSGLYFANTTNNTNSGWQKSNTPWALSSLSANTRYAFTGQSRNGDGVTTTAAGASKYTLIEPLSGLAFSNVTTSAIGVASTNTPSNLTSGLSGLYYANTTKSTNSGWLQNNNAWTSTGLSANARYAFTGQSRNGDGTATTEASGSKYTLIEPVSSLAFSDLTTTSIGVASTNTPSNLTSDASGLQFSNLTRGTLSGWQRNNNVWTSTNLSANTQYVFEGQSRNGESVTTTAANTSKYTLIEPVSGLAFPSVALNSISVGSINTPSNLTAGSSGLYFTNTTKGTNSGWRQDNTPWVSSGLSVNTQYAFTGSSRNGDATATSAAGVAKYTLIEAVSGLTFSGVTSNSISVASTNTLSNLSSGMSGLYLANTTIGLNSGWKQDNTAWTTSSTLTPNTQYTFSGQSRNGDGVTTTAFTASKYTLACTPTTPTVTGATAQTLVVAIGAGDGNPATTLYAIRVSPAVSGNTWVQANGSVGASAVYQTAATWSARTVTGLAEFTTYSFTVTARNGELVLTSASPAATGKTLDGTGPTGTVTINGGAGYTSSRSVTLTLAASDASGSGVSKMQFSNDGTTWSGWGNYATSAAYTLASGDGAKNVYAQFKDVSGNVSTGTISDGISLDTALPTVTLSAPSVSMTKGGPVTYTITYADAGSGVSAITLATANITLNKTGSANATVGVSGSGTSQRTVTLSGITGDGHVGISIAAGTATDAAGNATLAAGPSTTFKADNSAPTGTVVINNDVATTSTLNVTLTLNAADGAGAGVTQTQFSNDNVSWSSAETYATTKAWALAAGADGLRTVYAKFADAAGNWSTAVSDTISLNTALPTGTIAINSGAAFTTSLNATLTLAASSSTGTITNMKFSNDGTTWSTPETYAVSKTWTLASGADGSRTVYVQYQNSLAAWSPSIPDTITVDTAAPTGTVIINGGATYANSAAANLALTYDDGAGSGVAQMQFSNDGATWSGWEAVSAAKTWTLAEGGDGLKTVRVQFKDALGNVSTASITDTITLDATPPTGTIAVNGGAVFCSSANVTLSVTSSDGAGSGVTQMQFSNDGAVWSGWEAAGATKSWTLSGGDGQKTVSVQFEDAAGNVSAGTISADIALDSTPPTGAVLINGGAAGINTAQANLTLSSDDGTGSGVAEMQFSNDGATWSGWETAGSAKTWTLAGGGDGLKTVYVQFKDTMGNVSSADIRADVVLDTVIPTGTITINDGAASCNAVNVALALTSNDGVGSGVAQMQFSNDGTTWSSWEVVASAKTWMLASGDGPKSVYVQFEDAAGNVSNPVSAGILLDATPPTGTLSLNSGAAYCNSTQATLAISASDGSGTGVTQMRFSDDGEAWSSWEALASSKPWTLSSSDGPKSVYVQLQDAVGNVSSAISAEIVLDMTPPTGAVAIDGDSEFCDTTSVALTLASDDGDGSGVAQMQFSNDGGTWSDWESVVPTKAWTLPGGDGPKTVYVQLQDAAGNMSSTISDFIILDTIPLTAEMTLASPSETDQDEIAFNVAFNKPVTPTFDASAVSVVGLSGSVAVSGADPVYTVTVTLTNPNADGTVAIHADSNVTDELGLAFAGQTSPVCHVYNWHGFLTQPQPVKAYVGGACTFTAVPNCGASTLTYHWKRANSAKTVYDGPTTASWNLTGLTAAEQGDYWCEVAYSGVVYSSNTAALSVRDHLTISTPPSDAHEAVDGSHTFMVLAAGGYTPLMYQWKKDGSDIFGATEASYTRAPLAPEDTGTYTIDIADANTETVSASAELTVTTGMPATGWAGAMIMMMILGALGATKSRKRPRGGAHL